MKLTELISEGLIKLPSQLLDGLIKNFIYLYLAYYKDYIEEHLEGKDYSDSKKMLDQTMKKYGITEISDDDSEKAGTAKKVTKHFEVDPSAWPQQYMDRLKKLYPKYQFPTVTVTLVIDFQNVIEHEGAAATFEKSGIAASFKSGKITLSIPNHKLDKKCLGSPNGRRDALTKYLPIAVSNIEHELTHATQHAILAQFHRKQVQSVNDLAVDDRTMQKYYTSQIEFDPQVKSEAGMFKSIEQFMKMTGNTKWDRKKAMMVLLAVDEHPVDMKAIDQIGFTKASTFFSMLKHHDIKMWKKAVKLFYQIVG